MLRTLRQLPHLLARDQSGVAAVEFAVLTPFLLLMLAFVFDVGTGFYRKMQVHSAAEAGAASAAIIGFDPVGITAAVRSATPLAVSVTPAPRQFCGCPSTLGISETDCSFTCPGPVPVGTYVSASARASYEPVFAQLVLPNVHFTWTAVVRIR